MRAVAEVDWREPLTVTRGRVDAAASSRNRRLPIESKDLSELDAMVRLHQPVLLSVALHLCRDSTEASDLVQDTLERALVGFGRRQPGNFVRPWLMAILRNRFIDSCRRRAGMKISLDIDVAAETLRIPEVEPEPGWAGVTALQLQTAVDSLSEEFRIVYQMHAIEGRSYQEIAAQLGIPKATVGTRLLRARRKLKDALLQHLPAEEES